MHSGFRMGWLCAAMLALEVLTGGCDYARMRNDEAVDRYEMEFPAMPQDVVPLGGGMHPLPSESDPTKNPLEASREALASGKQAYSFYCVQCHGPNGDGRGTVGQSFAPLPTDLKSDYVLEQTDGQIFERIGKGYKRHPPLAYTVSIKDRWAVVLFMRAMAQP
jgi:mono/diheme cytochrome c family protein